MSNLAVKSNKVIVITGASAGVGRAIAHRFAREGYCIGLVARDAGALEDVRREVEQLGGRAVVVAADVADAAAMFAAADRIAAAFGKIDLWVNNAMVTVFSAVRDITPEEFRRVTEVTYLGCVHGTMAALRHMRPANSGSIIQIGSALAYRGIPLQSAYCGAKHAIRGFTDSLRAELRHEGSRINLTMVQLPAVNTPQFEWARAHMRHTPRPVAPVVQPEVIANAVFRAADRPAREYWIGSSTLKVGFQDQRVGLITSGVRLGGSRRNPPAAIGRCPHQRGETGVGIKARPAEPIDRAIAAHKRRSLSVSYQSVIFEEPRHDQRNLNAPASARLDLDPLRDRCG